MSSEDLIAAAELGDKAEAFMQSDLGRYFVGVCDQEVAIAVDKLKAVEPDDSKTIRALQNEIWRAESAKQWFAEIIQDGQQAFEVLKNEQETS